MSDVCIKCAGKPRDYRSESGHLTYDPLYGTMLEPHERQTRDAVEANIGAWIALLAVARQERRVVFADMQATVMLEPSGRKAQRLRFYDRINTYIARRKYFTPSWTDEARRAFYAPVRRVGQA